MSSARSSMDVSSILDAFSIEDSVDDMSAVEALMNASLNTLAALRLLIADCRDRIRSKQCSDIHGCGGQDVTLDITIKTFTRAASCILSSIDQGVSPSSSRSLLIESLPDESCLAKPLWNCLSWLITDPAYSISERINCIQLLTHAKPELVKELDRFGRAPLCYAATLTTPEPFIQLLAIDASSMKSPSILGDLPLHNAARFSSNVETFSQVYAASPEAIRHADGEECLPLHLAARFNTNMEVLSLLLQEYPEAANICDGVGRFALHHAALSSSSVEIVKKIFNSNPDIISDRTYTTFGRLALHVAAVFNPSLAINRCLLEMYEDALRTATIPHGRYPLHESVWFCHNVEVVRYYLSLFPEAASTATSEGHFPLHFLLDTTHLSPTRIQCLHLLLHAFPQAAFGVDNDGETPWSISRRHGHGDAIARLLLRAGPQRDPELLKELNWKARRTALLLSLSEGMSDSITARSKAFRHLHVAENKNKNVESSLWALIIAFL